jgi:hypothetical protein
MIISKSIEYFTFPPSKGVQATGMWRAFGNNLVLAGHKEQGSKYFRNAAGSSILSKFQ